MQPHSNPLTNAHLRQHLVAYARKRGPKAHAEDMVQEALAQAVENPPPSSVHETEEGLIRWLSTVVRNKIIDHQRRQHIAMRFAESAPSLADPVNVLEAREVLGKISVDSEPLRWVVREAEGDTLAEIAREQALPEPVVRQRVSRSRRRLRAALMAAAMFTALGYWQHARSIPIGPDPASMESIAPTLLGDYIVESLEAKTVLPPLQTEAIRVHITSTWVEVSGPIARKFAVVSTGKGLVNVSYGETIVHATLRSDGARVYLESHSGPMQGRIVLRRVP